MKTTPANSPYHYDAKAANGYVRFFELCLKHTKGEWSGQPFKLPAWQKKIIADVFGWKREDGTRRYRTVYIEVPRKNGKSTLCGGLGLLLTFADQEPGAEVYSAAADREQASIVFRTAKEMFAQSDELRAAGTAYKFSIVSNDFPQNVYRVLSADAYTKHGLNAHGIIVDELHAQPNRDLWDVLTTSTGARRQPITIAITTAGFDRNSICWELHEYARQVIDGTIDDPAFYPVIFAADEKDDWTDEKVWAKANPNLGVSVKLDYLRTECKRAQMTPAYQNTFRRLHLNQWTQQDTRWLDIEAWNLCNGSFDVKLLEGATAYGGLDLASSSDIAAFVLCIPNEKGEPEHYTWLPYFWVPEEKLIEKARKDRVPYDAWARDGLITATPGNVIDYDRIAHDIGELATRFQIREIAFDRWGAVQLSQQLTGAGMTMVGFGQGFVSMSQPTRELLRVVLDKKLSHGGHPVLRWMADNLVVTQDPAGNIKPNKAKSREKIDGMVAGIMALDRAIRHGEAAVSGYETHGLRMI